MLNVARVEAQVVNVRKSVAEHCSSVVQRRHAFDYVTVEVAVVVLREVKEICGTVVVDSDVDARQLVEADIMVSDCANDRHQVSERSSQPTVHSKEIVPSIGTGRHVVVVGNVTADEEYIGF